MKKFRSALVLAIFVIVGTTSANANDSFGFSIHLGVPSVYVRPPVIYAPPPVHYSPPAVIYYEPAPVYYVPNDYYRYYDEPRYRREHGYYRSRHKHGHGHDSDDDDD